MNINIVLMRKHSKKYIVRQTEVFCSQKAITFSSAEHFYYNEILFRIQKQQVQISTLYNDEYRCDTICKYIDKVFSRMQIGIFGDCDQEFVQKLKANDAIRV